MKTFDQETYSLDKDGFHGDCMRACVYSLLGENIGLPHPITFQGTWNREFFNELQKKTGKILIYSTLEQEYFSDIIIRVGMSPRGIRHAVIWSRSENRMLHDPHPSRDGLISFDGWYALK